MSARVRPPSSAAPPAGPLPLIRHLSRPLTRVLLTLPVSANQITAASLALGLASAWLLATRPGGHGPLAAALLLVVAYVLDTCDGEVARARGQCSRFGAHLDNFADWLTHSAFFAALGLGATRASGEPLWLAAGLAAAAGATINYLLVLWLVVPASDAPPADGTAPPAVPHGPREWLVFAFRELSRADFCFLVLLLAAAQVLHWLLPAAAVGAQVYWVMLASRRARQFRV